MKRGSRELRRKCVCKKEAGGEKEGKASLKSGRLGEDLGCIK